MKTKTTKPAIDKILLKSLAIRANRVADRITDLATSEKEFLGGLIGDALKPGSALATVDIAKSIFRHAEKLRAV